jgi:glycosyltransferase involved in cell wall biosynthesis
MYRGLRVGVSIPISNQAELVVGTIEAVPDFVDLILVVNDGGDDGTLEVLNGLTDSHKGLVVLGGAPRGLGYAVATGLKEAVAREMDLVAVMTADGRCDPEYLSAMCDEVIDGPLDYVKANQLTNVNALREVRTHRRRANVLLTIANKFATGYYSIFDCDNVYGVFGREVLERLPFELFESRQDYEDSILIALSAVGARVKDHPVPVVREARAARAVPRRTFRRTLNLMTSGFWRRIYYKYVIFDFHPVALFLVGGLFLALAGIVYGLVLVGLRVFGGPTPTGGTVLLAVLPFLAGLQLLLTAVILDFNNEHRR